MKYEHLLAVGPWSCPLCGSYASHGFWLSLHLQREPHSMTAEEARAYILNMCETLLPRFVKHPLSSRGVVARVGSGMSFQLDLFDKRPSLVSGVRHA